MPNIFIPNKGNHDFSDADRYLKGGSLFFISSGVQNRFSVDQMLREWEEGLKNAKKEDYILVTSLSILNIIGACAFVARFGRLNLLLFKSGKYLSRSITFSNGEKG